MAERILGITLPIRRGANGFFENTTNILTQVKSNLTNLLLTRKGERVMQPEYGCDIWRVIFQPITDDGLSNVRASIETAIQLWMPFVQIEDLKVVRDEDHNSVLVQLQFSLTINQNLIDTITLVF